MQSAEKLHKEYDDCKLYNLINDKVGSLGQLFISFTFFFFFLMDINYNKEQTKPLVFF